MSEASSKVLVLLADGSEEMEFTIVADVLRRAGLDVTVAGLDGADPVTCSRGVVIRPDRALAGLREEDFGLLVLPGGGEGAERFCASAELGEMLRARAEAGRDVAAICAAPSALVVHGVAVGRRLTSHPAVQAQVAAHGLYQQDTVVVDGPFVTSRGPGTAFAFALALVERLCGAEKRSEVEAPMMFPDP